MRRLWPNARQTVRGFRKAARAIRACLAGEDVGLDFPVSLSQGTPFQRAVWEAARLIPRGEVRTYGWVAAKVGRPGAARAVGQAMARNPLPLVVPCHRVLRADGSMGGFSAEGGLALKAALLRLEGVSPGERR